MYFRPGVTHKSISKVMIISEETIILLLSICQLYGTENFLLEKIVCQPSFRHQQSAEYGFRNGVLNFIQVQQRGTGVSAHTADQSYKTVTRLGSDHDISISCHVDINIFLDYSEHTPYTWIYQGGLMKLSIYPDNTFRVQYFLVSWPVVERRTTT